MNPLRALLRRRKARPKVQVWWTPDCGFLHVTVDPATIPFRCPDGHSPRDAHFDLEVDPRTEGLR